MTCSTSSTTFWDCRRISGARSRREICSTTGLCSKREASLMYGADATVVKTIRSEALSSCVSSGMTVTVRWCSGRHAVFLNFSLSTGDLSYKRTSSISHPVSTRKSYTYRAMNPVPTMPSECARRDRPVSQYAARAADAAVRAAEMIELSRMAIGLVGEPQKVAVRVDGLPLGVREIRILDNVDTTGSVSPNDVEDDFAVDDR